MWPKLACHKMDFYLKDSYPYDLAPSSLLKTAHYAGGVLLRRPVSLFSLAAFLIAVGHQDLDAGGGKGYVSTQLIHVSQGLFAK